MPMRDWEQLRQQRDGLTEDIQQFRRKLEELHINQGHDNQRIAEEAFQNDDRAFASLRSLAESIGGSFDSHAFHRDRVKKSLEQSFDLFGKSLEAYRQINERILKNMDEMRMGFGQKINALQKELSMLQEDYGDTVNGYEEAYRRTEQKQEELSQQQNPLGGFGDFFNPDANRRKAEELDKLEGQKHEIRNQAERGRAERESNRHLLEEIDSVHKRLQDLDRGQDESFEQELRRRGQIMTAAGAVVQDSQRNMPPVEELKKSMVVSMILHVALVTIDTRDSPNEYRAMAQEAVEEVQHGDQTGLLDRENQGEWTTLKEAMMRNGL